MNARTFLDNFVTIAEAPGGLQRLRDFVLDLAVSGRLVDQDPLDQPAESLLEEVAVTRESLPKHRGRPGIETESQETPSSRRLPPGWAEAPLGDVSEIIRGITFPATAKHRTAGPDLVPCLRTSNVQKTVEWQDLIFVPTMYVKNESQFVRAGDLLMSMANSRELVGKVALINSEPPHAAFGGFLAAIRPLIVSPQFLQFVLQDPRAKATLIDSATQTTNIANISLGRLRPFRCPIPPLAEQERIVVKVDELMGLCDELEVRREHRHRAVTYLRRSALHALTEAETPDDLHRAWERADASWSAFTNRLDDIAALRDAMTHLAVEGRLVRQDANEEPAFEVLRSCQRRKAELVKAGSARSRSELEPMSNDELPYGVPPGWAVARLDDWCDIAGGLAKGRNLTGQSTTTLPYLRVANVKAGYLVLDEVKQIEVPRNEIDRYSLQAGDVLLTEGGDWDKLGRSAIWTGEIDPCLHQNHIFRARTLGPSPRPEWISLFTNSDAGRVYFQSKAKRTTNLASINMTELRSMPLPVPPLAEQDRILTRLAELTNGLATLESALQRRDRAQRVVADCLAATT